METNPDGRYSTALEFAAALSGASQSPGGGGLLGKLFR
jgi:hypothetical protein